MAGSQLKSNAKMKTVLEKRAAEDAARRAQQAAERIAEEQRSTDRANVRDGIRETVALAKGRGEEVQEGEFGSTRVLARDGLLWLKEKGRLSGASLSAALRWRDLTGKAEITCIGASGGERIGGGLNEPLTATKHAAAQELVEAKKKGLHGDRSLALLMDEVAGKGTTIREMAGGDQNMAISLEAQFHVACRLLASFWRIGA